MEDEMRQSYLDYAMSVIVGRALPDVRDGLKPVHRRVLFAMNELGNAYNRAYKKSARVVGDVIGKYHPHGDSAVYETIVRMAQDFSLRYPLVDGQGNFGSIDGDAAAAMRYTEVRMAKLASELLADLDKETVDFGPNYDDSLEEPLVMPSKFPNLVVNGSAGIAVGMATNIPPHNLRETIDACIAIMERGHLSTQELMQIMQGPDFPTGASILGRVEIFNYFETGRGIVRVRAKAHFETHPKTERTSIVVDEIPYQVNKAKLIEAIADLVRDKRLEGISDLRDESDRDGMRIVIDLKRDAVPEVVQNQLFKHTALETSFGVILLAIVAGQPRVLSMVEMLHHFIQHRREVVTRRSRYELRKARERFNILLGLLCALDNIDRIISIIRGSPNVDAAKEQLLSERFQNTKSLDVLKQIIDPNIEAALKNGFTMLNEPQVQAILDMRLQRLVGLERDKILAEAQEVRDAIAFLLEILGSDTRLMQVIKEELVAIREEYGDERKTTIEIDTRDMSIEDLIADEEVVVTVTHGGYIKRSSTNLYRAQKRGGRGKSGITTKEEDYVENIFVTTTHSHILVFTNKGKLYTLRVHELPEGGLNTRGKPIVNMVQIEAGEKVQSLLPLRKFEEGKFVFTATRNGLVKKTDLMAFANTRVNGIIAVTIEEGDYLIGTMITDGKNDLMLATQQGMAIRFNEEQVRPTGRGAIGVKGISLEDGDQLVSMDLVRPDASSLLTVCQNGYGKRTDNGEYRDQKRGGKGLITIKTNERNGLVVTALTVMDKEELMISTDQGTMIRLKVSDISVIGRNTQGVRLINVQEGEKVTSVARIDEDVTDVAPPEDTPEGGAPEDGTPEVEPS
jgi:DNA gyrase subunit A